MRNYLYISFIIQKMCLLYVLYSRKIDLWVNLVCIYIIKEKNSIVLSLTCHI